MIKFRATIVITTLLLLALSGAGAHANDDRFDVLNGPKALPEFSLVDQNGVTFTREQLKGQWTLLFLGFTSCPDICPLTLMKLAAVRKHMTSRVDSPRLPEVVLLAVDPERDQENLKSYVEQFGPHNAGITGDWEQIDILVEGLGGAYRFGRKHGGHHGYEVVHTTAVYVINPEGALVASMGMPLKVPSVSEFLVGLTAEGAVTISVESDRCQVKPAPDVAEVGRS